MMLQVPFPFVAVRLDAAGQPWRLPVMADLYVTLLNLPVAYGQGSPGAPFSCAALPGRYIPELFQYGRKAAAEQALVILNPAYELPPDALAAIAAAMQDAPPARGEASGARVLADMDGRVIAYAFDHARVCPESTWFDLRFLSGFDAGLDADLMNAVGIPTGIARLRMPPGFSPSLSLPRLQGLEVLAVHVAKRRLAMHRAGARRLLAVVTHHAGDIFLAMRVLAACETRADAVVVHEAYADIAREVCPALPCITVGGPLPARGAAASMAHPLNDELLYLESNVFPILPADASILLMRPVRDYITADTTLAAQLAFAAGSVEDMLRFPTGHIRVLEAPEGEGVVPGAAPEPVLRIPGKRVLLHFDGGWPLKVYPESMQLELVQRLLEQGFQVSIMGRPLPGVDVPTYGFTGMGPFNDLLRAHDVLVGMDSFPCHYAAQQLGMPVLCLFASTRIVNLAHAAPAYQAASRGLFCSPCGSRTACWRFGGSECRNFISPAAVVGLLEAGLVDA